MKKSKVYPNERLENKKSFKSYIPILFNVTSLIILVTLTGLLEESVIPSHRQGFFCNDNSIKYPYRKEETISSKLLFGINYGLSIILYMIGEICGSRKRHCNRKKGPTDLNTECKWYLRVLKQLFSLTWSMAATLLITSIIKSTAGSLRPHFIEVCKPDVDCSNHSKYAYHLNYSCQANKSYDSQKTINQARRSFPSGHSSFSAAVMGFNILYIQYRYRVFDFEPNYDIDSPNVSLDATTAYIRLFLQILSIGVASFTSMSRVMDYHHHLVDVTIGFILGTIIGLLVGQYCIKRPQKLDETSILKTNEDAENANDDEIIQEMEPLKECN